MKNIIYSLAFVLFSSITFANNPVLEKQKNVSNVIIDNHLKISINLGNLTHLNESELFNLLDNLPTLVDNSNKFGECTISYTVTVSVFGQSVEISASGTASTCEEAGRIARNGVRSEAKMIKMMVAELLNAVD